MQSAAQARGRPDKDADTQIKGYATAFRSVLHKDMPAVPAQNVPARPSLPLHDARNFQRAVAKESRAELAKDDHEVTELDLDQLLELIRRNEHKENDICFNLPLEDVLLGPGHVAWKLMQDLRADTDHGFEFNEEQILVIAFSI